MRHPWFARLYDPLLAPWEWLGLRRRRREVVGDAEGLVLEVGTGTGLNLPHYRRARHVVATDVDPAMLRQARRRAARAACPVTLVVADTAALPFRDGEFDGVVATCVFCSVPDPPVAFRELRRVLKPGGELRIMEHVRASAPFLARLQDAATPFWSRLAGGCRLNRPTLETLRQAGFVPVAMETAFRGVMVRARLRRTG